MQITKSKLEDKFQKHNDINQKKAGLCQPERTELGLVESDKADQYQ